MGYSCSNGKITILGFNDACTQPWVCADAAADSAADATPDGVADAASDGANDPAQAVCTPGLNQTCNDNLAVSSFRGRCTDAGTCVCNNDAAPVAASGRCQ